MHCAAGTNPAPDTPTLTLECEHHPQPGSLPQIQAGQPRHSRPDGAWAPHAWLVGGSLIQLHTLDIRYVEQLSSLAFGFLTSTVVPCGGLYVGMPSQMLYCHDVSPSPEHVADERSA